MYCVRVSNDIVVGVVHVVLVGVAAAVADAAGAAVV